MQLRQIYGFHLVPPNVGAVMSTILTEESRSAGSIAALVLKILEGWTIRIRSKSVLNSIPLERVLCWKANLLTPPTLCLRFSPETPKWWWEFNENGVSDNLASKEVSVELELLFELGPPTSLVFPWHCDMWCSELLMEKIVPMKTTRLATFLYIWNVVCFVLQFWRWEIWIGWDGNRWETERIERGLSEMWIWAHFKDTLLKFKFELILTSRRVSFEVKRRRNKSNTSTMMNRFTRNMNLSSFAISWNQVTPESFADCLW